MSSTKIINVLKDDSFQEILELFKSTPSDEVIFVLPKTAKAFNKEEHFATLRDESKDLGKSVSFLCSNSELNDMAKKYKFEILLARSPAPKKKVKSNAADAGSINVVNQIEDFYAEPATSEDSISTASAEEDYSEPEPMVVPAMKQNSRRVEDVFIPDSDDQHNVKVSGPKEKAETVEVKRVWGGGSSSKPEKTTRTSFTNWLHKSKESLSDGAKGQSSRRPTHRTALFSMAIVAVIILGLVIFITTGKAQISITPVSQPLDISLNVVSSDNTDSVNLNQMAIPGQLFYIQKTVSQDFTATGHVDVAQKARGTITVYNNLSTTQPLIATTRFESADHHIFHTLTSIIVPAATTLNGKTVPGTKDVQVIADKAGQEYNVPAGQFTIPAFKEKGDTEKYQKVYGQSTLPIRNGTSGQSTVVTDTDLSAAKKVLTDLLNSNIQDELKSQIDTLKVINSNQALIGEPVSTNPADSSTSTFKASLFGSLKTVGFKESDLQSLITQYVDSKKGMMVLPDKLTLAYSNPHWDDVKHTLSFTVHVTGSSYSKFDKEKIVADLLGKNDTDMRAYLGKIEGISSAHVSLSPFWVNSIPKNKDKVEVDILY